MRALRALELRGCDGASDLLDAVARSAVATVAKVEVLARTSEVAVVMHARGACRVGPRSGLDLLFRHVVKREREQPGEMQPCAARILKASQALGMETLALRRLLGEESSASARGACDADRK